MQAMERDILLPSSPSCCPAKVYPFPLVGEFPNPPENEKKESVAALQHRKTGTKRSAAEIYILRKKSNLYIFRKKESLIQ